MLWTLLWLGALLLLALMVAGWLAAPTLWRAWRRHPAEMLRGMMVRFPARFLAAPFQPVDSIVQVQRYAAAPAVEITRLDRQWQRLRAGEAAGGRLCAGLLPCCVGGRRPPLGADGRMLSADSQHSPLRERSRRA